MTFQEFQTANNASGFLEAAISSTGDTLIIKTAYADLFPDHNGTTDKDYLLTLEHFIDNKVTKREIVRVIARATNTFTIVRGAGYCPSSRDATEQTNTAFGFSSGDVVELRETSENDKDIKDEIVRLDTDKLDIAEYQAGQYVYGASSTGDDDYEISIPVGPIAYTVGQIFRFQADTTNTGTATLNVNGIGVIPIKKQHDRNLEGGDIEAGQIVTVCYDGTNMQMDSQVATIPTVDIHGQDEKTDYVNKNDEIIIYDFVSGGNKKIKISSLEKNIYENTLSSPGQINTGTIPSKARYKATIEIPFRGSTSITYLGINGGSQNIQISSSGNSFYIDLEIIDFGSKKQIIVNYRGNNTGYGSGSGSYIGNISLSGDITSLQIYPSTGGNYAVGTYIAIK